MPSPDLHDLLNQLAKTLADQSDMPVTLIRALRKVDEATVQGGLINIGGDIITATGSSIVINRSDHAQVIINRPDAATLVTAILQVRQRMADEQVIESHEQVTKYLIAVRDYYANLPYLSLNGLLQRAGSGDAFSLGQSYIDVQVRQLRDMTELGGDWELNLWTKGASIRNDAREFSSLQAKRECGRKESNLRSRPTRSEERQHRQERMSEAVNAQDAVAFLRMKRYLEWVPMTVVEMMQQHALLLILGEGGVGKSTLLRHLAEYAWDAPEQIGLDKPHLPLLIPLQQLAKADGSLEDRLNQVLTSELVLIQKLPDGFFTAWSAQTGAPWLILLDALDEVPADERARLIQWLASALRNIGPHRVVITSRPPGYMWGEFGELFHHYELLSFTSKQINEFARKWFGDRADRFMEEIERIRIGDLHGTPLLLTIAAKIYLEKGTLPESRSELYGQFVSIWLNEAEIHKLQAELDDKLAGPISLQKARLAHLALRMTEHPGELLLQTLSNFAAEFLQTEEQFSRIHAETYGKQFVEVMARRSGVLTHWGNVYDFVHPTFREYLAAQALAASCECSPDMLWSITHQHIFETEWVEVLSLTLIRLQDPNRFIDLLFTNFHEDIFSSVLLTAGKLMRDIYQSASSRQNEIIRQLQTLLISPHLKLAMDAFYVLRNLDEPLAFHSISELLSTPTDPQTRLHCLRIIEDQRLGGVLSERLFSVITDPSSSIDHQIVIVEILKKLDNQKSKEHLFSLLTSHELRPTVVKKIIDTYRYDRLYQTRMLSLVEDTTVKPSVKNLIASNLAYIDFEPLKDKLIDYMKSDALDREIRVIIAMHLDPEGKNLTNPILLELLKAAIYREEMERALDEWDEVKAADEVRQSGYDTDWTWAFASRNVWDLAELLYRKVSKDSLYYDEYGYNALPFLDTLSAIKYYAMDTKTINALWRLLKFIQSKQGLFNFPVEPVFNTLHMVAQKANVHVRQDGTIIDYQGNPIDSNW